MSDHPYIKKVCELYDFYCPEEISETPDEPKKINKQFTKSQLTKLNREYIKINKLIEEDTPSLSKILSVEMPEYDKKFILEKFILFIQTEKNSEEYFDYRDQINKLLNKHKIQEENCFKKRKLVSENDSLKEKITALETTDQNKKIILSKFEKLEDMNKHDSEYHKIKEYINKITSVPFGKYSSVKVDKSLVKKSKELLDKHVMFNKEPKDEIINYLVNDGNQCVSLYGPPGTAKSTLVQKGISEALGRPMRVISLGGKRDASYLTGHSYTYEGAVCGRIIDILIETGVMNPIIYFDELDKISGDAINGVLTHLIDPSQNFDFHDNYFSGISFDLSKVLFVFSYNDKTQLDSVVSDRIKHIEVKVLSVKEKIEVMENITIPSVFKKYFSEDMNIHISFSKECLFYIATKYHNEGMRNLIREIDGVLSRLKVLYFLENDIQSDMKYTELKLNFNEEIVISKSMFCDYFETKSNGANPDSLSHLYL